MVPSSNIGVTNATKLPLIIFSPYSLSLDFDAPIVTELTPDLPEVKQYFRLGLFVG
jgi:hypothetical protein